MRRFAVIAILLLAMLSLNALKAVSDKATDPLTLAAIGFVVLASFTLAEFAGGFGLPKVTGYILAGLALGPFVLNILSIRVVTEMRTFNSLALGLIAVGAGLELDLKQLKKVAGSLAGTVAIKVVLGVVLVGGTFWGLYSYFDSIKLVGRDQVMTVALSVGVLSIGTSPSISLAVISETRAKGRLTDLVLGAAVLKDLVVVVCLAVAIAMGKSWLALETEADSVFFAIVKELGSSLLAGTVLGVVLILYIRFVKVEMLLFVAGTILVVSELGHSLHLELLLVFIAAGFVVRNFSKHEHELMSAVELVSLPVFVVFFTIAGAGLDLVATWQLLPLALALCSVRALVYYIAGRVGGALGGESPRVQGRAWLGYLPQAGVTLGLVGLTAAQLPTVSEVVTNLGIAVVAVNLLLGPITLKFALRSVGEIPATVDEARAQQAARDLPSTEPLKEPEALPLEQALESIEARSLRNTARELTRSLHSVVAGFETNHVEPWCKALEQSLHRAIRESARGSGSQLEQWLEGVVSEDREEHAEQCRGFYYDLREQLRRLPDLRSVPYLDSQRLVRDGDKLGVRLRIRAQNIADKLRFWRKPAQRRVAVQRLARASLELRLASFVQATLLAYYRTHAGALEDVRYWIERQQEATPAAAEELQAAITRRLQLLRESYRTDADTAIRSGMQALAPQLNEFDGPRLPASRVQLGRSALQIKATIDALDKDAEAWGRLLLAVAEELKAIVALAEVRRDVEKSLLRTVIEPASAALTEVNTIVGRVVSTLDEARLRLERAAGEGTLKRRNASLDCEKALSSDDLKRLETAAARYRAAASVHSVAREARLALQSTPESILVPVLEGPADRLRDATDIELEPVNIRAQVEQLLEQELFPALDRRLQDGFAIVASTASRVREALDICQHALDSAAESTDSSSDAELGEAFTRAISRLEQHMSDLVKTRRRVALSTSMKAGAALIDFSSVMPQAPEAGEREVIAGRFRRSLARLLAPASRRVRGTFLRARAGWTRALGSQLSRDVQRRLKKDGVDATELASHIGELRTLAHVPASYARVFSAQPVREHRLFTANKQQLRLILETERVCFKGGNGSALVVGPVGSGRTSLLNLCELELSAPRIVRPEPLDWRRSVGLEAALGIELGCPRAQIADELRRVHTTVLVDDLEHWFAPTPEGLSSLTSFFELLVKSDDQVFWLVTVEQATLDLLEELTPIQPAFSRIIRMPPLGPSELMQAVEGRNALSGRSVSYPSNLTSRLLSKLGKGDSREVCFRVLCSMSGGNLGAALAEWLRMCTFTESGDVIATPRFNLGASASLLAQLPATELAILTQLTRFGPFTSKEIAEALELTEAETRRHTHFLRAASVIEPLEGSSDVFRISTGFEPLVVQALQQAGAVRRRGA